MYLKHEVLAILFSLSGRFLEPKETIVTRLYLMKQFIAKHVDKYVIAVQS
jgi:hypothetical protein